MKYLTIIALACFAFSCRKKQPEMNDFNKGCDCAKEVSADFSIEEMSSNYIDEAFFTECDTVYTGKGIRFNAAEVNAEYTWIIGTEVLNSREVIRSFPAQYAGQLIPIKLVVKKKPNTICFPGDDGIDTLVKYVTPVNLNRDPVYNSIYRAAQPNYDGVYRVKELNSTDSVEFTLDFRNTYPGIPSVDFILFRCDADPRLNKYGTLNGLNYRKLRFKPVDHDGNSCHTNKSSLHVKPDRSVELQLLSSGGTCTNLTYKGRKL